MKTIRVLGSGPLTGKVFYGTYEQYPTMDEFMILVLDTSETERYFFSTQTGMSVLNCGQESDLLRIDPREIGHEFFSPLI